MSRNKRPPLGARVRATAYYRKLPATWAERLETQKINWELVHEPVQGIYCGERYLTQKINCGEIHYPQIRTFLVALDHRRRVSCMPSDVEVIADA